ncbi:MAG: SusC/RagA family TonB-linked outer membrane protein, partial [Bacteroidota bacterium]
YADKEVKITGSSMNVVMEPDANVLDEVIVAGVAAGTSKKKLSVSVAKVGEQAIKDVPAVSAASALQGKVAGVTITSGNGSPGSGSTILLRGATNITGSQKPMILIDGVIMEGSLSDINVDDIQSMEVVKGAAASSLYGSRAGNGVVVITTKRGSSLDNNKTSVTFRNEYGFQSIAKKMDVAEHHAFILADDYMSVDKYTKYAGVTYPADYEGGQSDGIEGDRMLQPSQYMDQPHRITTDHQDDMFTNGAFYTNYVGIGHRINKTNLFASFENNANQGVLIETGGYKRQSFRLNVDHAITEDLKFSASNNYIKTSNNTPGGSSTYNGGVFFDVVLQDPDVNLFQENPDGQSYNLRPNHWAGNVTNPLYELWKKERNTDKVRFLGSYDLNWRIADWISAKVSYAFESREYKSSSYDPFDTYTVGGAGQVYTEGYLRKYASKEFAQTLRGTINLTKSWEDLTINGKLSYLWEDNHYENFDTYGNNFTVRDLPTFNAIKMEDKTAESFVSDIRAENYFGIVNFIYKDRYIFDALYRLDGSSLFGENERYASYYRISGAYRLSEDIDIPGFNEFKIRGAYGTSGQRPGFNYQYETLDMSEGNASKVQLGNADLKPSRSTEIEVGIDAQMFERVTMEFTYANTKTDDQILERPLAAWAGGFATKWENAGALEANTFEASINSDIIRSDKLNWNVGVVFDRTRTEITRLDIPAYQTGPDGQDAIAFYIREGEMFGTMYGKDFVKSLDQMEKQLGEGESIDNYEVNSDGYVVTKGSQGTVNESPIILLDEEGNAASVKIGDTNPDFKVGLTSNLSWRGLSFYMLWQWKQGGDIYNRTGQWMTRDSRHSMMDQYGKAENEKKAMPYYQGLYDVNSINSFWVEDGTYVKLKEMSLYYNFDKGVLGNVGNVVENIKVGFIARNLLTFTDYSGYDPEVATYGETDDQIYAFDFAGYPNFRTYSFSLEFKF